MFDGMTGNEFIDYLLSSENELIGSGVQHDEPEEPEESVRFIYLFHNCHTCTSIFIGEN